MDDGNENPNSRRSTDTVIRDQGGRETRHSGMTSRRLPPPWDIGQRLGDFQLQRLLGQGSSGYVFRALDLVTQRTCALKILTPQSNQDLRRNKLGFRRMMAIQHPSLMRVDLIHILDGHVALSMEEVHGDTLARTLRRYKTLPQHVAYKRLLALARQYGGALAEMHSHGLVHRDIKPQNLMVDQHEIGRVIDYGLVGTFDPESDPNGFRHYLAGTPRYWSPEALADQFYTPSGDVFSLGLVMLEALYAITGKKDWERSDKDRETDAQLISEAVEDLSDSIPYVLRDACLEMLQINPEDRPSAHYVSRLGLPVAKNFILHTGQQLFGRERELEEICDWLRTIYEGKVGRLHIHGPSGIGKTRLIDEVERHLRSLRWGQVFRASCRPRDEPLQAFDQFADEIATRYGSFPDREPLEVDVASAAILHRAFPALVDVVHASMKLPPISGNVDRIDAMEAAVRLSVQLRKVGPLILIMDDIQLADPDSLSLLDRLQVAGGEMLGIITLGRSRTSRQQKPPSHVIEIKPLSGQASRALLADAAARCSVNINRAAIAEIADAAAGNPFRLKELTEEFRPGGALSSLQLSDDSSISNLGSLDKLWQRRVKRLSENARKVLLLIATATRPVSTAQLCQLTGLGTDEVDVAVSELVRSRLAADEATREESIAVVHDRVAQGIISGLASSDQREAHKAWARLLLTMENQEQLAARIANHLFDAGEPLRAVSFAILAAEGAERLFAKTEAARWYVRVLDLVDIKQRLRILADAARCYDEADQPVEAAKYYRELAAAVDDPDQRLRCRMLACQLLIRSGRFDSISGELSELCSELKLPRPNPGSDNFFAYLFHRVRLAEEPTLGNTADDSPAKRSVSDPMEQQRLESCVALARPLSMFDNVLAARLLKAGMKLAARHGSLAQQLRLAIGVAVYEYSQGGSLRTRARRRLNHLREHVTKSTDSAGNADFAVHADYWAAIATTHALSMNWHQVIDVVRMSINEYESVQTRQRFEKAHTRWLEVWAGWHLGHWRTMRVVASEMLEDAQQRHDDYSMILFSGGYAAAAMLADDRLEELRRWQRHRTENSIKANGFQFVDFLSALGKIQIDLYLGRFSDAWLEYRVVQRRLRFNALARVELIRVTIQSLGALTALHLAQSAQQADTPHSSWLRSAERCTQRLRREASAQADVVADLAEGLRLRLSNDIEQARNHLISAHRKAKELQLLPLRLAAEDLLEYLETGEWLGLLRHRMRNSEIKQPERFERLYTVVPPQS